MTVAALQAYAREIRTLLRANPNTPETGLAPSFQTLLRALLPDLDDVGNLTVVPEYNRPGVGRPDIALILPGQPARAFIELKAPALDADPRRWTSPHNRRQYERLRELAYWSTCNFRQFRLYGRDQLTGSAQVVPDEALLPDTPDAAADAAIEAHDATRFMGLFAQLARAPAPVARNAEELAHLLAHSARIVDSAVRERVADLPADSNHPLAMVRNTFRNVLYAHPEAGGYDSSDFDALFASAFAQTLAFGLLLVREHLSSQPELTESEREVGPDAWNHMPDEHPLMRAALRVLSQEEVASEFGIGFDVMRDTVNSFAPEILAVEEGGRDPILYFYEDFLEIFDPRARERYGVFYTPVEVVRYMVGALDRALRENLGTQGLQDPAVTILDPATGTGTFLLGVAEQVREQVRGQHGRIEAAMALSELAGRMYGLELLVGPYAVAHYRLHHALQTVPAREEGVDPEEVELQRLGVYLADTLSNPEAEQVMGELGMHGIPIAEERREAQRIKAEQPILAIIGNPPYRRLERGENETLVGRWMDGKWDDLKGPVREAGWGNQLNTFPELSIAFWRWAIWKLFEANNAPQRGVIAYITNRKFLTGKPYSGLRKMMRERFDRIEIIDLRGDVRAGVRGDVARDQGVFSIQVGTAITVCIADGSKDEGALAEVSYLDCWADSLFTKRTKLDFLQERSEDGRVEGAVPVERELLSDFRPEPFGNGEWVSLTDLFMFRSSGIETTRDQLSYGLTSELLQDALRAMQAAPRKRAAELYSRSRKENFGKAYLEALNNDLIIDVSYRPLWSNKAYNSINFIDWPRPSLQAAWGHENFCLFAMAYATSRGPGLWAHAFLPDRHAFKGSTGGYAFPLYDRREGPNAHNLDSAILAALSEAYGEPVAPETLFDAVLALLSASSYTVRFAEDLEDTFPHIPFPADLAVLNRAAEIGSHIRALETFARPPDPARLPEGFGNIATRPAGPLGNARYENGELILCADGTGGLLGIPQAVWDFAVSGYRVLPRWLEARNGQELDRAKIVEIRDIAGRIHELLHWFDQADLVLDAALADTLSREELGLDADPADEGDD